MEELDKIHNFIVLSICDSEDHFYSYIKNIPIYTYIIIITDKEFYEKVSFERAIYIEKDPEENLYTFKLRVIKYLLERNVSVLYTDIEAEWNKDIIQYIDTTNDLSASQGLIFPEEVYYKWNFVLCSGLFHIRANEKTIKLINDWIQETKSEESYCDQRSLNRILQDTHWEPQELKSILIDKFMISYSDTSMRGYNSKYSVYIELISMKLVQRTYLDTSGAVYNLLSDKRLRSFSI